MTFPMVHDENDTPNPNAGRITEFQGPYRFLSNFWPCDVFLDGVRYPSVEHAFQAAKTLNTEMRLYIRDLGTPGEAKKAGRGVTLRTNWEIIKNNVMGDLLRQKFIYNSPLKNMLLATSTLELIEGNTWGDTYWGVCNGVGENHLGKMLMSIRAELNS